jgi:predicted HD superfamily hydrolase involved in NAD metabolism
MKNSIFVISLPRSAWEPSGDALRHGKKHTWIRYNGSIMIEFNSSHYIPFLQRVLTPSRFQHSLGVMQVMGELAKIYALDEETALTTGLLHDAAKDLSVEQIEKIVIEAQIEFHDPSEHEYTLYLHGPVGAYYVQKELGVSDPVILDAIYRHTWVGKIEEFESPLVWCLRFSDILEPNRKWDGAARKIKEGEPRLRQAAFAGQLEEAAFIQAEILIDFFEDIGSTIHPNYYRVYRDLSARFNKR